MTSVKKFIDIGANMTDAMFRGMYHGSRKHEADIEKVLQRAYYNDVNKLIITGTNVEASKAALDIAMSNERLYATVGCHPTSCNAFEKNGDPAGYLGQLKELILQHVPKVVAIGECGLDYDRLHFCEKIVQQKYFDAQLNLCKEVKLPLFLHCRNAADDFINIIKKHDYQFEGVVHSFDGTVDVLKCLLDLGFYIGVNGCSLKTEDNLEVVKHIPRDKLLLETDCPWCDVRPSHAGYKYVKTHFPSVKKEKWKEDCLIKSRNEPSNIVQILEILSTVREEPAEELCQQIYENTLKLFRNIR